jgi:hypothetical protein
MDGGKRGTRRRTGPVAAPFRRKEQRAGREARATLCADSLWASASIVIAALGGLRPSRDVEDQVKCALVSVVVVVENPG